MLLAANWDDAITNPAVKDPPLPPLVSLSSLAPAPPAPQPLPPAPSGSLRRRLLLTVAGLAGLTAIVTAVITLRRRP